MELKILEDSKGKLCMEVVKGNHTLLNLVTENAWKAGAKQAGYITEHPYLSNPKLTIMSASPKKTLQDAVTAALDDVNAFRTEFKRKGKD